MLKFIQYQIEDDTEAQQALEKQVSAGIAKNINRNIAAFREHIPSLVDIINSHQIQQYSLFCTKEQQLNIVDFSTGRAFYGANPQQDVGEELAEYFKAASYFSLSEADGLTWRRRPLPNRVDVMLVFGMGLGYHLTELISNCRIRFLVVYEPNLDMLMCSVQTHDWSMLLDTARVLGTHIFIQAGSDASGITGELAELLQFDQNLTDIYVYRHQFHPVMDDVINYLMENSGNPDKLLVAKPLFEGFNNALDYVPERASNTNFHYVEKPFNREICQDFFDKNMKSLKSYYTEIWEVMKNYSPSCWYLVEDGSGKANLYNRKRKALLYSDFEFESEALTEYFINNPFRDDVVLGMKNFGKLWSYLHFRFIDWLSPIMEHTLNKKCVLPDSVDSLIVFGLGLSRHVEKLLENRVVTNLYICEPNLDFFYASLFVVDWSDIFKKVSQSNCRLYINLGGDGSNYFYDLMAQFYQVGAYSIADTYMWTSYYNVNLQQSLRDLRAELKVVLALGEYYDHSRFGIAHTYHSLENKNKFMKESFVRINSVTKTAPVFVVGNGPSIDECFDFLKRYRENVILVSCGTVLRALHKCGIRPDFHAEIEQNRATYDWVTQVDDNDYLKSIRLISVNGIHPDTAALFKETLICFKDGEASTYVFKNGLSKLKYETSSLSYAYPTVTNMAMNFMLRWGFSNFYLFGIDLGYVDIRKHHSVQSSYYDSSGEDIYNYQAFHGAGVAVQGNFLSQVYTKPEFDVSRKLLQHVLKHTAHEVHVYNCSNGSKIFGATPLLPENILLDEANLISEFQLSELISETFYDDFVGLGKVIYGKYNPDLLFDGMTEWLSLIESDVSSKDEAKIVIKNQWALISGKAISEDNLMFMLMHGSANYVSAIMSKVASNIKSDNDDFVKAFNYILKYLRIYVEWARDRYRDQPLALDQISVVELFEKGKNEK